MPAGVCKGEWVPVPFVDGEAAALVFRHRVLALLRAEGLLSEERIRLLLSWRHSGFSVHASVTVPRGDRDGLERLARYLLRPPVSLERLGVDEQAQAIAYAAEILSGLILAPWRSSARQACRAGLSRPVHPCLPTASSPMGPQHLVRWP